MEVEFINAYVQKQKQVINDFLGQNILLETRLVLAEQKLQELPLLQQQLQDLTSKYEEEIEKLKQQTTKKVSKADNNQF